MPWILKGFLFLAKTRRGRRLLFVTALTVVDLAQRQEARRLYATARRAVKVIRP
jgi:hypothetical protein